MASLDMSLDDMIKSRKNTVKGGRGQGRPRRGRGGPGGPSRGGRPPFGAPRRNPLGVNARPSAYTIAKSFRRTKNLPWQSGLLEESLKAAGLSGLEAGTKLFISNLDAGVSNEDIRELFSEIGELIRYAIHFDKNGRLSGSAEVVFARRSDAFQALKRYNNVQLDGRPMKIEIVGSNAEIPLSARVNVVGGANGKKRTVVMASGHGRSRGGFAPASRGSGQRGRGGSVTGRGGAGRGGGRGRGRGRGRGGAQWRKKVDKSADDLDKELDSYHAEAMQT
ncbi:THO complex subunit 4D-like isoform X2 [Salvia hispanica]|uniref:THO complex subunit 4D-like isoform X2 n=1 Tax=Salvia hispanica TaxID=49212 RepID=UPI002008F2E6|nr:THO complex subunit 4D-like isoform X2 [Salvia hispanica]